MRAYLFPEHALFDRVMDTLGKRASGEYGGLVWQKVTNRRNGMHLVAVDMVPGAVPYSGQLPVEIWDMYLGAR